MSAGKGKLLISGLLLSLSSFALPRVPTPPDGDVASLLSEPLMSQQSSGYNVRHVLSV